jgi:uncharacterized protein (DUF39 family)
VGMSQDFTARRAALANGVSLVVGLASPIEVTPDSVMANFKVRLL